MSETLKILMKCDECGFVGDPEEFPECEVCKDHGMCPKCNAVVMWETWEGNETEEESE